MEYCARYDTVAAVYVCQRLDTVWFNDIALRVHTSELRDTTSHMGSHNVTCHPTQVNAPRLTLARKAGTRFIYPGGIEG